jgi:hypothetical protein
MVLYFGLINELRRTSLKDACRRCGRTAHLIVWSEEVEQNDGDRLFNGEV